MATCSLSVNQVFPDIPSKRYFTIGEVSELCLVKPHVLRYWEQEFAQLKPLKRSGNRRYYQRHEVLLIRSIRSLLYEQGFTISGARHQLENEAEREPLEGMGILPNAEGTINFSNLRKELIFVIDLLAGKGL